MFKNLSDQTLIKVPGQINGIDFCIMNLQNCEVYLMDRIAQIFVDDCTNCKIFTGPIEGSIFVRGCENVQFTAAAQQVRISNSNKYSLKLGFSLLSPPTQTLPSKKPHRSSSPPTISPTPR
jgi:protein XRP2